MKVLGVHQTQVDPYLQVDRYAAELTRALDHSPEFGFSLPRRGQAMFAGDPSPDRWDGKSSIWSR